MVIFPCSSSHCSDCVRLAATKSNGNTSSNISKKKSNKKKKNRQAVAATTTAVTSRGGRSEGAISQEDLANHVSNMYINSPRGVLRRRKRGQRDRGNALAPAASAHAGTGRTRTTGAAEFQSARPTSFLDGRPALVLNADYQPLQYLPLSLWNWQDAVKSIFSGKVTVVDVYPDVTIRAASLEVPLPSVIALNEYVKPTGKKQRPAFTRRNVFLRDEYRCQYCNERFATNDLSIDHVVPRCQGGRLHWENAVTSCLSCNGRKGSLPVDELRSVGMRLLRKPSVPSQIQLASIASRMKPSRGAVHPTWEPFLGIIRKPTPKMNTASSSGRGWHSDSGGGCDSFVEET